LQCLFIILFFVLSIFVLIIYFCCYGNQHFLSRWNNFSIKITFNLIFIFITFLMILFWTNVFAFLRDVFESEFSFFLFTEIASKNELSNLLLQKLHHFQENEIKLLLNWYVAPYWIGIDRIFYKYDISTNLIRLQTNMTWIFFKCDIEFVKIWKNISAKFYPFPNLHA